MGKLREGIVVLAAGTLLTVAASTQKLNAQTTQTKNKTENVINSKKYCDMSGEDFLQFMKNSTPLQKDSLALKHGKKRSDLYLLRMDVKIDNDSIQADKNRADAEKARADAEKARADAEKNNAKADATYQRVTNALTGKKEK